MWLLLFLLFAYLLTAPWAGFLIDFTHMQTHARRSSGTVGVCVVLVVVFLSDSYPQIRESTRERTSNLQKCVPESSIDLSCFLLLINGYDFSITEGSNKSLRLFLAWFNHSLFALLRLLLLVLVLLLVVLLLLLRRGFGAHLFLLGVFT